MKKLLLALAFVASSFTFQAPAKATPCVGYYYIAQEYFAHADLLRAQIGDGATPEEIAYYDFYGSHFMGIFSSCVDARFPEEM